MAQRLCAPVIVVLGLALSACGDDRPKGADNSVVATVTPTGTVASRIGDSQAVRVSFVATGGALARSLSVSGLSSLPSGWTSPSSSFSCASVGASGDCTLTLTYAPSAPNGGTLVLQFVYVANNGLTKSGVVSVGYAARIATLELLAGSILGGIGNLDGTGAEAHFYNPRGVAAGSDGTLYVADESNHVVRKVTPAGVVTTVAGLPGESGSQDGAGSAARFSSPRGVAVGRDGTVYVADTLNSTIRRIGPDGVVTTLAGSPGVSVAVEPFACKFNDGLGAAASFCGPEGIAVAADGTLYVADTQNSLIRKITPAGAVSTLAGSQFQPPFCVPAPGTKCPPCPKADGAGTAAGFCAPHGIAIARDGTLYVTDGLKQQSALGWSDSNDAIRRVSASGVVTTVVGHGYVYVDDAPVYVGTPEYYFDDPRGIAVDGNGVLYVVDTETHTIRSIAPSGEATILAGTLGEAGSADGMRDAASFYLPDGATADSSGLVYVADRANGTIRSISPSGVVATLAGAPLGTEVLDGAGKDARFVAPQGIAVDGGGVLYATDHRTVRRISPTGIVTTLAGSPLEAGFDDGIGSAARFTAPQGAAVDAHGNVYVTDSYDATVRKVTPAGVVTTLAGTPRVYGAIDAVGPAALFGYPGPGGIAVDATGMLWVTDSGNNLLRRITAAGAVTTLAGLAGVRGTDDGVGPAARFNHPQGITLDSGGTAVVADMYNCTIRTATPAGLVRTVAGTPGNCGWSEDSTTPVRFNIPRGVAVDAHGNIYVADSANHVIRRITPAGVVSTALGNHVSVGIRTGEFPASLAFPRAITFLPSGELVVLDGQAVLVTRGF